MIQAMLQARNINWIVLFLPTLSYLIRRPSKALAHLSKSGLHECVNSGAYAIKLPAIESTHTRARRVKQEDAREVPLNVAWKSFFGKSPNWMGIITIDFNLVHKENWTIERHIFSRCVALKKRFNLICR
jgi:hypothetical protein